MLQITTGSVPETQDLGVCLAGLLPRGSLVCLTGELGAGKTAFAQGVARGLGIRARVSSPTFTLINEYPGDIPLYHLDLYRLERPEDLEDLGLEEYFASDGVALIEWAERAEGILPDRYLGIEIERAAADGPGETGRLFRFVPHGEDYIAIAAKVKERCGY